MGDVYIDGRDVSDSVGDPEIRERRMLSEEGVVTAVAVVDLKDYQIVAGPDIVSRGFVYMHESQELIKAANHEVFWAILNTFKNHKRVDSRAINRMIVSRLQRLLYDRTGRRPVIIPMVTILNADAQERAPKKNQAEDGKKGSGATRRNNRKRRPSAKKTAAVTE